MGLVPTARIRKRRRVLAPNNNKILLSLLCLVALFVSPTRAVVSFPRYNEDYTSLPARFGGQLAEDPPVRAYLTIVKDQPLMCTDEFQYLESGNSEDTQSPYNNTLDASMPIDKQHDNEIVQTIANQGIVPLPPAPNGLPIAILVERGNCTFYEKAIVASQYGARYVIIYDNTVVPDLVPMSSDYETDMTLLFVSATAGRALKDRIITASQQKASGWNTTQDDDRFWGYPLVVELDGRSPYFDNSYRGLNMAAYFLVCILERGWERKLSLRTHIVIFLTYLFHRFLA